ncbi:MAG: AhpC/TSA family protein [Crocinitomicaceae bacterium]|nr:AhpC/TSA family protein [Crocinitomicaceae bacterium]
MKGLKHIFFTLAILAIGLVLGQVANYPQNQVEGPPPVYIEGKLTGGENMNVGLGCQSIRPNSIIKTVTADENGKFIISTPIPFPDYYYLVLPNGQTLNLALRNGDSLAVFADASDLMKTAKFVGDPVSAGLNDFIIRHQEFKRVEDSLKTELKKDPTKQTEVNTFFATYAPTFFNYRNQFIQMYGGTPALIATVNAIDQEKEWALFVQVVDALNQTFAESPSVVNIVKYKEQKVLEKQATAFLEPGNEAKEIAMQNPTGDTLRLSDLRGKIVLIDFWASWCRPCRAENPNVVKLYNKYNEKGFEVFSVSLDGKKEPWEAAIKADGLIWPYHVSDLKKWGNAAAQAYAVKSIPFTVLIDREGKIIATKLRGQLLENQLKTIFGF